MPITTRLKDVAKAIMPPPLAAAARRVLASLPHKGLASWWRGYRDRERLPHPLVDMIDYYVSTADQRESSNYWNWLCRRNIEQIAAHGLDNFKQTVAKNYFTWVGTGFDTPYARNLVGAAGDAGSSIPLNQVFKKHQLFSIDESIQYNLTTLLLHEYVCKAGGARYLDLIEEPEFGNPPCVNIAGRRISQDILNSVLEFMVVTQARSPDRIQHIIEIGAGSGRTAFCFLTLLPRAKYVIVDIPPALFISQTHLSRAFPRRNIFTFRPFSSFEEVSGEFDASDIAFLTPDQLPLLPDAGFDLFLAIDCLHEMKKSRVQYYFAQADRLATSIYFKCWETTEVPFDRIMWTSKDYPVHSEWSAVFKKPCMVPASFFEAFFDIPERTQRKAAPSTQKDSP